MALSARRCRPPVSLALNPAYAGCHLDPGCEFGVIFLVRLQARP
jgi:hypothetical protein